MPKIFICYRREDSGHQAGRLYDHLRTRFGQANVFKDVDSIPLGRDFRKVLADRVGICDVLLALVGDQWLTAANPDGERRLDDPADFVRIEIETALNRDIPLIPLLVGRASIPTANLLPPSLQDFAYRHSISIRPDPDFLRDVERLIRGIDEIADTAKVDDETPPPLPEPMPTPDVDPTHEQATSPPPVEAPAGAMDIGPLIEKYGASKAGTLGFWLFAIAIFCFLVFSLFMPESGPKKPGLNSLDEFKNKLLGLPVTLAVPVLLAYLGAAHSRISVSLYERGFIYSTPRFLYFVYPRRFRNKNRSYSWADVDSVWVRSVSAGIFKETMPLVKFKNKSILYIKGVGEGRRVSDHMSVMVK